MDYFAKSLFALFCVSWLSILSKYMPLVCQQFEFVLYLCIFKAKSSDWHIKLLRKCLINEWIDKWYSDCEIQIPFSTKRNEASLVKMADSSSGARNFKLSLDIISDSREANKNYFGECHKDPGVNRRGSHWPKMRQIEHP